MKLGSKFIKVGWVKHFGLLMDTHLVWLETSTMLMQ